MRIHKFVSSLVFVCILGSVFSFSSTVALGGKFRGPSGRQFNGYVRFSLPFAGAVDTACDGGGSCLALPIVVQAGIVNGAFDTTVPAPRLIRNIDIQPAGTYYRAFVYDSSSRLISASNFAITGVGTFDVGAALQTSITTNNVSYITPADLNGNNTWTGTNTFNGAVVFNSTVTGISFPCGSSAAANTVCGNNTGAPTGPSYVKVNYSMTDGTTIAALASPTFTGTPAAPTPATGDVSTKLATTAFVNNTIAAGQVIGSNSITSCALALSGGEWNCGGTFSWGATLPISNYKVACTISSPQPSGSYPIPSGYDASIYYGAKTTTGFGYTINDDHSGSLGATYFVDCIASR